MNEPLSDKIVTKNETILTDDGDRFIEFNDDFQYLPVKDVKDAVKELRFKLKEPIYDLDYNRDRQVTDYIEKIIKEIFGSLAE